MRPASSTMCGHSHILLVFSVVVLNLQRIFLCKACELLIISIYCTETCWFVLNRANHPQILFQRRPAHQGHQRAVAQIALLVQIVICLHLKMSPSLLEEIKRKRNRRKMGRSCLETIWNSKNCAHCLVKEM